MSYFLKVNKTVYEKKKNINLKHFINNIIYYYYNETHCFVISHNIFINIINKFQKL